MQPAIKIRELDDLKGAFSDEIIEPLASIITEREFAYKAQEIQVPANKWIGRIRHEICDILCDGNLKRRIRSGFTALIDELYAHAQKHDVSSLLNQWKKGVKNLKEQIISFESPKNTPITLEEELRFLSLQDLMGFSDKYLNDFYACGRTYYLHKEYQKAADVFFVVTLFDFFRHSSWVALGLCEEKLGHWTNALHAFSIGSLTRKDAPIPYIHSAECYIVLNQLDDAKNSLECAKQAMLLHPSEADVKLAHNIIELQDLSKSGFKTQKPSKIIQFSECSFKEEGEFNRWQWDPINYSILSERTNVDNMVNIAREFGCKGGSVLRSLGKL